jgi:hypothetical protein
MVVGPSGSARMGDREKPVRGDSLDLRNIRRSNHPASRRRNQRREPHELTSEEQAVVLPRIKQFLEGIRYFYFFGRTYPVVIEREPPVTAQLAATRRVVRKYWQRRKKADQKKD